MPAPVSITAPNSPKKRGGKTSYGGSRPSPSGGHTAPARTTPTVTTVSPSGAVVSSGPSSAAATARARASQARVRRIQHAVAMTHKRPSKPITPKLPSPTSKPKTFLGKRTVGTPTLVSLQRSLKKGNLMLTANQKAWTTPQVRKVTQQLKNAAPVDIPGFSPSQEKNLRTVVETGKKMGATHKELLASVETGLVEAPYFHNPSGGDADSEGWRQERTSIYGTGPTGPTNVKASAKRFFQESVSDTGGTRGAGMTAGELAQTIQGSAFPARYDEVKSQAVPILKAAEGKKLPPKLIDKAKSLGLGKQLAKATGIGVDATRNPNSTKTVLVRADGAGMVKWAKAVVGTGEGTKLANKWAQESGLPDSVGSAHPWCAAFIAAGLRRRGITPPSNGAFVGNYLPSVWGKGKIVTTPKPGDLILYGSSHIALYIGGGKQISGNESDAVTLNSVESGATYVRPPYTGKKVPVKVSDAQLVPPSIGGPAPVSGGVVSGGVAGAPGSSGSQSHKPTGAEILAKLKKYGVGTTAPTTSTSSATLAELEKRYGAPTV